MTARHALTASLAVLIAALPLAACKKEADKNAMASGEILPGSISDAMIPQDRLTSQPPLDPNAVRNGPAKKDGADDSATGEPEAAASEAAEPAAAPEPASKPPVPAE